MNKAISIIIPIYNEKNSIAETVNDIFYCLSKSNLIFEIILVDDGSTDGSSKIINQIKIPNIKKIIHSNNRGYGAALKSGIKVAKNEIIVITDADGSYPNKKIPELVEEIKYCDMVVGARTGAKVKIPFIRKPAKWIITKLAAYLTGVEIPDLNSGLRVIKKEVLIKFINILPDGFSFTTTITLAILTNNYRIKYLTINYFKRQGKSKIKPVRDSFNFIQLIIKTVLYFKPLKIFTPLSLVLFLLSFGVLIYSYFFTSNVMDVTVIVLFVSAIQILAIGALADLINKRLKY
jgi:glycosyltransferase involved in cell wall biosynthesis